MYKLVEELVKLQLLCKEDVENNTNLKCITRRDLDRILMGSKMTISYNNAVNNLIKNIKLFTQNEKLLNEALNLKYRIENSKIANLRFGLEPQRKFEKIEAELDSFMMRVRFQLIKSI